MKKVLLLENDEGLLDVVCEALTYEGFGVKCLQETDDIFSEIKNYTPDVVILDYLLNGITGGELCHQIKVNGKTSAIPVIIVSAYPKVLKSLGYYGCDDFIPKPFDLFDLTARIQRVIDQSMNRNLHVV